MPELDINVDACRGRQRRVLDWMETHGLEAVVLTQNVHIQYLVGPRFRDVFSPAAVLGSDGTLVLIAPDREPPLAAADEVRIYQAKMLSTLRNDQRKASSLCVLDFINRRSKPSRVGCEFSSCPPHLSLAIDAEFVDAEPELYRLRRRKDADELARLKKAIAGTESMHRRAREIVAAGVNELDVYNELQAVANREYGEVMTGTGNDYASGVRGGPPRDRRIEAGELYILDLGPAYRGYFADNTRTIAVDSAPTDDQLAAWQQCLQVFKLVEEVVRPGKSCRELFHEAQAVLDQSAVGVFNHHLGHGIGLYPHEAPYLNPNWDDHFQVGEVFAVEPGLYAPEFNVGMRLENNYLVTEDGVALLSDFPLEL